LASFGPPGDYDLNISCTAVPANDDCATALLVTDGVPAAEGDNSQASDTDDDEASCQEFSGKDVWFEYVATCDGTAVVDTSGSGQEDTVLSAYDACGGSEIACNDDDGGGLLSSLSFVATAGQSYWIRLASFGPPGDYDLNIACANTPPTVAITAPPDGAILGETLPITFSGTASDAEDGDLTDDLEWTSDLDGPIGTGGSFSTTLSLGVHLITASVIDSGGDPGADSISVTVTCIGDLNGDGHVGISDLAQLLAHYGETSGMTYEDGDLDGDGDVDLSDLAALLAVYGSDCS
jgi:hypothetical protein